MNQKVSGYPNAAIDEEELCLLMVRYQAGDLCAADDLVRRVSPVLYRYLLRSPLTRSEVTDVLQECWLQVHRARHTFRNGSPVLPWLFAIARHTRRRAYRRQQRTGLFEAATDDFTTKLKCQASSQEMSDVLRLIDGLPGKQGQVLLLHTLWGYSFEEIAKATSSTATAVKQQAYRACVKLREILQRGLSDDSS